MMTKCEQCGAEQVDALQRAGGVSGLDFLRTRCGGCGAEQIFHGEQAVEMAAAIDASNQQQTTVKDG